MRRSAILACSLACSLMTGGCAIPIVAPPYGATLGNVERLKDAGDFKARVGSFTADAAAHDHGIGLRAASLKSPVDDSFASYLADALRQELSVAHKLAPDAKLEVSGVLLKNDISIGGFATGYGDIEARFIVKRGEAVRFDRAESYRTEWDSSMVGAVAIPKGQQAYPALVQGLLAQLYADPGFIAALR